MLEIGLKHTSELIVEEHLTAIDMGSGDMPVLATPAMLALMENAAMLAITEALPKGCTSVVATLNRHTSDPQRLATGLRPLPR